ncbi:MAG: asparagine synthase (glutamine-hydrolyzing) [Alphaproteobacteria bacterium]|nr:asparagine synthase (glutamine-hydrolyzing) [Alphaproteobacteria bacterium]
MCGIAGFFDTGRRTDARRLTEIGRAMTDAMPHRGPDMGDVWADESAGICLGFRRLAIIDLSPAGHQPMHSADGRYVLTYNGEIYNYRELADDVAARGHSFRGSSDTEVMLELFARDGVAKTLPRLIGMFAIALWDRQERQLTLIRDRLGIKPLYFGRQNGRVFWGSELKAVRAHPEFEAAVDPLAMDGYLKGNAVPAPNCIYRDMEALSPGGYAVIGADGEISRKAYWSMADVARQPVQSIDDRDLIDRTEELVSDAVRRRMVADVPLGALLSGGVDSSTVVALMQKASDRPVKTYTIGFGASDYDEADHARAVATHLGTDHTELSLSADDARDLIPNLPDWFDEPFADSSALPTYLVCRLAQQSVTVALSGDGGDEVFFGYNRHRALNAMERRLGNVPNPLRRLAGCALAAPGPALWDGIAKAIPSKYRPRMAGTKAQKLARALAAGSADDRYLDLITHWPEDLTGLGRTMEMPDGAPDRDAAARAAWADTVGYLPNDILTKVDRASMAVSLEARVPLLDHRVVEFAWTLPTHAKIRNGVTKWPLREVLYRHVPKDLVDRPKSGFAIPLGDWLSGPLRDWAETLLAEDRLRARGWVDPAPIRRAWRDHLNGRGARAEALWGVCMLEAWADRWVGRA